MKICLLTNNINQVGGVERVISTLSKYFVQNKKYDVTIISLYTENTKTAFDFGAGVKIRHAKKKLNENVKAYLKQELNSYDVLLTFHPHIGLSVAGIRRYLPNLKWIATEHWSPYNYTWKRELLNLFTYHCADKLVVLADDTRKYYRKRMILHIKTIPNALPFETEEYCRYDSKRIVAVGRLEEVKQFDILIKAFSSLASKFPEWSLYLIGDGSQRTYLESIVDEGGVKERVHFCGYQQNMKEYLLNSSFMVISSKYEGFSLVALEALGCGLPLVSFDLPTIKDITNGYDAILTAKQGNIKELSDKMERLIKDKEALQRMGKEAKECSSKYSIKEIGKQWDELLREVCGN